MTQVVDQLEEQLAELLDVYSQEELAHMARRQREVEEFEAKLGPQTKEELWQWFKDEIGVELGRVAVCPGHSSQLDIAWEIYSFEVTRVLLVLSRGGGKTSLMAWLDYCQAEHFPGWESFTIGPGKNQGERKYDHLLPFVVEGGVIGGKEKPHIARSTLTKTEWPTGSSMEIALGGTPDNANGPRVPRLHRDETELMRGDTYKQAGNIPAGRTCRDGRYTPAQIVDTSTMKWAGGRIDNEIEAYQEAIKKGQRPRMQVRIACFTPETRVRTLRGLVPISEVTTDDWALTEGGHYERVRHTMKRWHDGPIRVLKSSAGLHVRVTPEHPIAAVYDDRIDAPWRKPKNKRKLGYSEQWCRAESLDPGTYVRVQVPDEEKLLRFVSPPHTTMGDQTDGRCRHAHPSYALDKNFLWAVGLYIAEGCPSTGGLCFTIHEDEVGHEKRLRDTFEPLWFTVSRYPKDSKGVSIVVHSRQLRDWWPDWIGRGSHNKRIPSELFNLPVQLLRHVVEGVLDGDGCERWAILFQTSPVLATQMVEASLRDGGRATLSVPQKPYARKQAYVVTNPDASVAIAPGRAEVVVKTHAKHRGYWKVNNNTYAKVVRNDEEHYEGFVYDLTIGNGTSPSFVVENMLVHNCIFEVAAENPACRSAPKEEREARLKELGRDPCELCDCNTYISDVWEVDDTVDVDAEPEDRTLESVCQGRFFRSRGYKGFDDVQTLFQENDRETWEAEQECSQPAREGAFIKAYSEFRHGIKNYVPDPFNGPILQGVDWGGVDEHSVGWYQYLEREVEVQAYKGDRIKMLPPGSLVKFAEIFKGGIGDVQLGQIVLEREAEFIVLFPGWHVEERYPDSANASGRMNWRDHLGLKTESRIKKDFKAEVKYIRTWVGNSKLFIDIEACPIANKAMKAWRAVNGVEVHDWSSHPMAEMRYVIHNLEVSGRKQARKELVSGNAPAAANDSNRAADREQEMERTKPKRDGERVLMIGKQKDPHGYERLGELGAEDSPLRETAFSMEGEDEFRDSFGRVAR